MLLEYSTSNIILRIEMLTMKKFVIFCILAWFPFLQGLLIRSSRRFVFATFLKLSNLRSKIFLRLTIFTLFTANG